MAVRVSIDRAALRRAVTSRSGYLQNVTDRAARNARQAAPGSMPNQITSRVQGDTGIVTSHHPASVFVVFGTRPHRIVARRAKALRFEVGGRIVFAKSVRHPGTRPNNFLLDALRRAL